LIDLAKKTKYRSEIAEASETEAPPSLDTLAKTLIITIPQFSKSYLIYSKEQFEQGKISKRGNLLVGITEIEPGRSYKFLESPEIWNLLKRGILLLPRRQ